ncbi:MAG: hypothetical protein WBM41_09225 [Arenicellales bacterium]
MITRVGAYGFKITIALSFAAVLPVYQALGQDPALQTGLPPVSIEKTDLDKDGNLSQSEYNQRLESLFSERDINNDSFIAIDELPSVNNSAYQKADSDNDNRLNKHEYIMLRQMDFKRLDVNEDEVLYPHEIFKW